MRLKVPCLCTLLLAVAACRPAETDAPADAYRTYAAALRHGDAATAWELLSSPTRDFLSARAKSIAEARGVPPPHDGRELAFGDALRLSRDIKSTSVASTNGDHARVDVVDSQDQKQQIQLVRENGEWHVDFTEELKAAR